MHIKAPRRYYCSQGPEDLLGTASSGDDGLPQSSPGPVVARKRYSSTTTIPQPNDIHGQERSSFYHPKKITNATGGIQDTTDGSKEERMVPRVSFCTQPSGNNSVDSSFVISTTPRASKATAPSAAETEIALALTAMHNPGAVRQYLCEKKRTRDEDDDSASESDDSSSSDDDGDSSVDGSSADDTHQLRKQKRKRAPPTATRRPSVPAASALIKTRPTTVPSPRPKIPVQPPKWVVSDRPLTVPCYSDDSPFLLRGSQYVKKTQRCLETPVDKKAYRRQWVTAVQGYDPTTKIAVPSELQKLELRKWDVLLTPCELEAGNVGNRRLRVLVGGMANRYCKNAHLPDRLAMVQNTMDTLAHAGARYFKIGTSGLWVMESSHSAIQVKVIDTFEEVIGSFRLTSVRAAEAIMRNRAARAAATTPTTTYTNQDRELLHQKYGAAVFGEAAGPQSKALAVMRAAALAGPKTQKAPHKKKHNKRKVAREKKTALMGNGLPAYWSSHLEPCRPLLTEARNSDAKRRKRMALSIPFPSESPSRFEIPPATGRVDYIQPPRYTNISQFERTMQEKYGRGEDVVVESHDPRKKTG